MILGDNASSRIFLWDKCNRCRNNPSLIMKGLTLLKKQGVQTVMDDKQIINLFFQRDEDAIKVVDEKYGSKLKSTGSQYIAIKRRWAGMH